jgi:tRNA-dihydrouridine synthase B
MTDQKPTISPKSTLPGLPISGSPIVLAPLAGVSDQPFRRINAAMGADLTYVEMLSAVALTFSSKQTFAMLDRHPDEGLVGVQVTGRNEDETARAIEILDKHPYDTIDINMGCPVQKVVKSGCGSAILKDPERVRRTVKLARAATGKPLSVKIRVGWDHTSKTCLEVAQAAASEGADWLTIHGRTRSDDYSRPVDLNWIRAVKNSINIPVLGNGNIFSLADAESMMAKTGVDGVMVSRGALGNPWVFAEIKGRKSGIDIDEWEATILQHLQWQEEAYGDKTASAIRMRKNLLWYCRGWVGGRAVRESINHAESLRDAVAIIRQFSQEIRQSECRLRAPVSKAADDQQFNWDPKFDMSRELDRGVGHEGLAE